MQHSIENKQRNGKQYSDWKKNIYELQICINYDDCI